MNSTAEKWLISTQDGLQSEILLLFDERVQHLCGLQTSSEEMERDRQLANGGSVVYSTVQSDLNEHVNPIQVLLVTTGY